MHTYIYIYNTIVYVYNYNIYIERKQLQTTTANTRLMLMWNYPSFPIHPYPIHIPRSRLLLCSLHAGAWGLVDWVSLHDCARHLRGGFWAPNTWFTHLKKNEISWPFADDSLVFCFIIPVTSTSEAIIIHSAWCPKRYCANNWVLGSLPLFCNASKCAWKARRSNLPSNQGVGGRTARSLQRNLWDLLSAQYHMT